MVAGWTAQLIDKKEYFIQTDIPQLPTQESQQMSLFDFAAFQQPTQAEGTAKPSIFPHPALPQQLIDEALCMGAVSYTHLDVYKRQRPLWRKCTMSCATPRKLVTTASRGCGRP